MNASDETVDQTSTPSSSSAASSKATKDTVSLSAQNSRAQVICAECSKPRVIYSNTKLDIRHKMMLAKSLSDHDYTCGSHLFSPAEKRKLAVSMVLRPNLQCAMPIEICYYGADIGRKDLCSHCASPEAVV